MPAEVQGPHPTSQLLSRPSGYTATNPAALGRLQDLASSQQLAAERETMRVLAGLEPTYDDAPHRFGEPPAAADAAYSLRSLERLHGAVACDAADGALTAGCSMVRKIGFRRRRRARIVWIQCSTCTGRNFLRSSPS